MNGPKRRLDIADGGHQGGEIARFHGCTVVGPSHCTIQRNVFFDHTGAPGDGGDCRGRALAVVGKSDAQTEPRGQRIHGPKIEVACGCGIRGRALK